MNAEECAVAQQTWLDMLATIAIEHVPRGISRLGVGPRPTCRCGKPHPCQVVELRDLTVALLEHSKGQAAPATSCRSSPNGAPPRLPRRPDCHAPTARRSSEGSACHTTVVEQTQSPGLI